MRRVGASSQIPRVYTAGRCRRGPRELTSGGRVLPGCGRAGRRDRVVVRTYGPAAPREPAAPEPDHGDCGAALVPCGCLTAVLAVLAVLAVRLPAVRSRCAAGAAGGT